MPAEGLKYLVASSSYRTVDQMCCESSHLTGYELGCMLLG